MNDTPEQQEFTAAILEHHRAESDVMNALHTLMDAIRKEDAARQRYRAALDALPTTLHIPDLSTLKSLEGRDNGI